MVRRRQAPPSGRFGFRVKRFNKAKHLSINRNCLSYYFYRLRFVYIAQDASLSALPAATPGNSIHICFSIHIYLYIVRIPTYIYVCLSHRHVSVCLKFGGMCLGKNRKSDLSYLSPPRHRHHLLPVERILRVLPPIFWLLSSVSWPAISPVVSRLRRRISPPSQLCFFAFGRSRAGREFRFNSVSAIELWTVFMALITGAPLKLPAALILIHLPV